MIFRGRQPEDGTDKAEGLSAVRLQLRQLRQSLTCANVKRGVCQGLAIQPQATCSGCLFHSAADTGTL